MTLIPVEDLADPQLEPYRELNRRNLTRISGRFIAEGEKIVEALIASRFEVESLLAEPAQAAMFAPHLSERTPIYVVSREQLESTIGFNFHRGVLACGRRRAVTDLHGVLPTWNEAVVRFATHSHPRSTVVVLPDVHDPTNLGSIIRTAAAFGCRAAILGPECADPLSRRVLRVSMGAALNLPLVESRDLRDSLEELRAAEYELVATVLDPAAEPLKAARRGQRLALLFGSEGHGLSAEHLAQCDRRVTIPMQLGTDSLNVAVAVAVVLYHFTA